MMGWMTIPHTFLKFGRSPDIFTFQKADIQRAILDCCPAASEGVCLLVYKPIQL